MFPGSRRIIHCCLLALVLLSVRVADAHVHLCFDGKEPPASIHVGDGGSHPCDIGTFKGHSGDRDVQLSPDSLVKKDSLPDHWVPIFLAFVVHFVAPHSDERFDRNTAPLSIAAPVYLRPPLRGPPA